MNRKALGKGIRAIIPEKTQEAMTTEFRPIPVAEIRPNPYQPRGFQEEDTKTADFLELVASIKEKGVLQPVVVRRRRDGYELILGERRWRAAKTAGLTAIPAIVRAADEREMLEMALVENLMRQDLNPIEEALGYKNLVEQFGLTHEEIARRMGRDRSTITNALRLLTLPFKVRDALAAKRITPGHARALLTLSSRREQVEICERIIAQGLSVRATERLCGEKRVKKALEPKEKDVHIQELEQSLQELLGTKVVITMPKRTGTTPGKIVIDFFSIEDLNRLVKLIKK